MEGGDRRVRDGLAVAGWGLFVMWGLAMVTGADELRTDPTMVRGDEKATLLTVSGGVLLVLAVVLLVLAAVRFGSRRGPLGPPVASVVLGWSMAGLFVVFLAWGVPLTRGRGLSALAAFELPYLIGAVAVLLARPRAGSVGLSGGDPRSSRV
jgi:hypothetical protein